MNTQNWYTGQTVIESEMDQVYTDAASAEKSLAKEAGVHQPSAALAGQQGGISSGLVVTRVSDTVVQVSAGTARDSQGRRISLPSAATVSLTAVGDTDEGDLTDATGDGTAVAITAGKEAWISLFLVYDETLSQPKVDDLGQNLMYRTVESFHFFLGIGAEAPSGTATALTALSADKILLADILLDDAEAIRQIDPGSGTADAICGSSADFNAIGYGLDDTPALAGRRSDQIVADADGTDFATWKDVVGGATFNNLKRYLNLRGTTRFALRKLAQMLAAQGDSSNVAGTELVGSKAVTGKSLTATATAAIQMIAGSLHDQLEALVDTINSKIGRGGDTGLTGNFITTGGLQGANVTATSQVAGATGSFSGQVSAASGLITGDLDVRGAVKDTVGDLAITAAVGGADINLTADTDIVATAGSSTTLNGDTGTLYVDAYGVVINKDLFYASSFESTYWLVPQLARIQSGWTEVLDADGLYYTSTSATTADELWFWLDNMPAGELYQISLDVDMASGGNCLVDVYRYTAVTGFTLLHTQDFSFGTIATREVRTFNVTGAPAFTNANHLALKFYPDNATASGTDHRLLYRHIGLVYRHTKISRYR